MSNARKNLLATLKPFVAGAFLALAGQKLLSSGRRRIGPPTPDPFGTATGRGAPTTPPAAAAIAEGYETTDASGRDLAITIAIFAGSTALVIGGCSLALRLYGGTPARYGNFTQEQRHRIEPPAPHLQADPVGDLARYQAAQAKAIATYGPLGHGFAHIPIARAMEIVQGKPLDPAPMQEKP